MLIIPDRTKPIDVSNELKLGTVAENIGDTSVAKRLQNEGFTSLRRLEKVRDIMETYLAERISITELFPRWDIWY